MSRCASGAGCGPRPGPRADPDRARSSIPPSRPRRSALRRGDVRPPRAVARSRGCGADRAARRRVPRRPPRVLSGQGQTDRRVDDLRRPAEIHGDHRTGAGHGLQQHGTAGLAHRGQTEDVCRADLGRHLGGRKVAGETHLLAEPEPRGLLAPLARQGSLPDDAEPDRHFGGKSRNRVEQHANPFEGYQTSDEDQTQRLARHARRGRPGCGREGLELHPVLQHGQAEAMIAARDAGDCGARRSQDGRRMTRPAGQRIDDPPEMAHRVEPGRVCTEDVAEPGRQTQVAVPGSEHDGQAQTVEARGRERRDRGRGMHDVPRHAVP
jgi:hypothetical protein